MSPCQSNSCNQDSNQRNLDQVQRWQQDIQMRIDQPAQENNHKTRNDQSKHDKKTGAQFHEKRSFPGECIMQSVPVKILAAMRAVGRKVAAEQKCTAMRAADANDAPDHAAQRQQGADRN